MAEGRVAEIRPPDRRRKAARASGTRGPRRLPRQGRGRLLAPGGPRRGATQCRDSRRAEPQPPQHLRKLELIMSEPEEILLVTVAPYETITVSPHPSGIPGMPPLVLRGGDTLRVSLSEAERLYQ